MKRKFYLEDHCLTYCRDYRVAFRLRWGCRVRNFHRSQIGRARQYWWKGLLLEVFKYD